MATMAPLIAATRTAWNSHALEEVVDRLMGTSQRLRYGAQRQALLVQRLHLRAALMILLSHLMMGEGYHSTAGTTAIPRSTPRTGGTARGDAPTACHPAPARA